MSKNLQKNLHFLHGHSSKSSIDHLSEQFSIERRKKSDIASVFLYLYTSLCDWSKRIASLSQPIRCKTKTNPREVGWFFTLSSHWLINVFSFLLSGFCDNFGFGITILDRKAFYNFSGPTSFYQDKSKPHYNSLNVIVDNFLTLSSVMGSIKKYHWDHEQDKNRYKLSQKRSKGVISLRYTN